MDFAVLRTSGEEQLVRGYVRGVPARITAAAVATALDDAGVLTVDLAGPDRVLRVDVMPARFWPEGTAPEWSWRDLAAIRSTTQLTLHDLPRPLVEELHRAAGAAGLSVRDYTAQVLTRHLAAATSRASTATAAPDRMQIG